MKHPAPPSDAETWRWRRATRRTWLAWAIAGWSAVTIASVMFVAPLAFLAAAAVEVVLVIWLFATPPQRQL